MQVGIDRRRRKPVIKCQHEMILKMATLNKVHCVATVFIIRELSP